jgi:hypothetical protein
MTPTLRTRKPRSIRLAIRPEGKAAGVVIITIGHEHTDYIITITATDFGRGFRLEKIGGEETYHVNLDGNHGLCDCKGFSRWNRCKHTEGLAKLVETGWL